MMRSIKVQAVIPAALSATLGIWLWSVAMGVDAATANRSITIEMGDYRFTPGEVSVEAGETVQLELTNRDTVTPHNFTLTSRQAALDVDVDVAAGKKRMVEITPRAPGTYTFFCNKKLPLMKSHRHRGMEGTLIVTPGRQR